MNENCSESSASCSVLLLVIHGGGVADIESDQYPKARDFRTFQSVFSSTASLLYPSAEHATALRLVECPQVCPQIVEHLRRISVFNEENGMSSVILAVLISFFFSYDLSAILIILFRNSQL